jgi:tRNA (cmo5U34)-methyltransferase
MTAIKPVNLWTSREHVRDYLERADSISHREEGEAALLEFIPSATRRILDLGTGDGRLLALVRKARAQIADAVAVDFSPAMLEAARKRFAEEPSVTVIAHNLDEPLPAIGKFDAVVSCFAIHHLVHERKRALYTEIYGLLNPSGVFCNLEHVSSPTQRLHEEFLHGVGYTVETEDPSNKLLDVETQLGWLREIGFVGLSLEVAGTGVAGGKTGIVPRGCHSDGRDPSTTALLREAKQNPAQDDKV